MTVASRSQLTYSTPPRPDFITFDKMTSPRPTPAHTNTPIHRYSRHQSRQVATKDLVARAVATTPTRSHASALVAMTPMIRDVPPSIGRPHSTAVGNDKAGRIQLVTTWRPQAPRSHSMTGRSRYVATTITVGGNMPAIGPNMRSRRW